MDYFRFICFNFGLGVLRFIVLVWFILYGFLLRMLIKEEFVKVLCCYIILKRNKVVFFLSFL